MLNLFIRVRYYPLSVALISYSLKYNKGVSRLRSVLSPLRRVLSRLRLALSRLRPMLSRLRLALSRLLNPYHPTKTFQPSYNIIRKQPQAVLQSA